MKVATHTEIDQWGDGFSPKVIVNVFEYDGVEYLIVVVDAGGGAGAGVSIIPKVEAGENNNN